VLEDLEQSTYFHIDRTRLKELSTILGTCIALHRC
jgi:hypothetical protein